MDETSVPVADSYQLPTDAYTDPAWFERERRELFDRTWQFVGMEDGFAADGDYAVSDVGSSALVVVRSGGSLRSFHNMCRHRGARIFDGRGNAGREIKCFYHSWAYGFDGSLKRVPQREQFPDLDMTCLGLHRASVGVWNGLVFVHPEPDAPPLAEWLGDMPLAIGPYEPLRLVETVRESFEVHANWKLFAENHIDGYHLWHLHSKSVVGLDHRAQTWRPVGRHWTFTEPPSVPGVSPTAKEGLSPISGLPSEFLGSTVHLLFPNLGVASGAEYWLTLHMVPVAADLTRVELRVRTMPLSATAKAAVGIERLARKGLARLGRPRMSTDLITAEDCRAAESVQQAMRSPKFAVGAMARDYEAAISEFQRNVRHYVADT